MPFDIYKSSNTYRITDNPGRTVAVTQPASGSISIKREQFGADWTVTLTLREVSQSIVNGTEYQSTLLLTFMEGRILVKTVTATLQQKTTSTLLTTLNASSTGAIALGTAAASSTTLNGTAADLLPSTAFTSSATINVAGTAVSNALAASAQFDGTSAALTLYLNTAFATTDDVDGNATQTISGTIKVTFTDGGDF